MNIPIPMRMLSIVSLIVGLAAPAQADLITPTSIIAGTDAYSSKTANTREVGNLLDGEEMQLKANGDANNWADWEMNHSGDRYGNGDAWAADTTADTAKWVIVDLGAAYQLDTISIWNMNPNQTGTIGRSAKTVDIYYTLDRSGDGNVANNDSLFSNTGSVWTSYSTGTSVSKNAGDSKVTSPNALLDNMGITARYIALDFTSTWAAANLDKVTVQELQFFAISEPSTLVDIPEPSMLGLVVVAGMVALLRRPRANVA